MTSQLRRLKNADFSDKQAEAIDDSIADATRHLATKAELYRAMWLLGLGMTTVNAAMLSAAVAVIRLA
ncbi:MAG: hypothetical protein F4Z08_05565 [Chloroflexi bacterium]|nr:hypothetical protein [Chloroflexota bacterium]